MNDNQSARLSVLPLEGNEPAVQEIFERFLKARGEIVEITLVAGLFNYFNRVNNALDVEPTAPSPFLD